MIALCDEPNKKSELQRILIRILLKTTASIPAARGRPNRSPYGTLLRAGAGLDDTVPSRKIIVIFDGVYSQCIPAGTSVKKKHPARENRVGSTDSAPPLDPEPHQHVDLAGLRSRLLTEHTATRQQVWVGPTGGFFRIDGQPDGTMRMQYRTPEQVIDAEATAIESMPRDGDDDHVERPGHEAEQAVPAGDPVQPPGHLSSGGSGPEGYPTAQSSRCSQDVAQDRDTKGVRNSRPALEKR